MPPAACRLANLAMSSGSRPRQRSSRNSSREHATGLRRVRSHDGSRQATGHRDCRRRTDGASLQPGSRVLPGPGGHQARSGQLLHQRRRRHRQRASRASMHAASLPDRNRRRQGASKRVPAGAPEWLGTVRLHFPRYGLHADELCVTELAEVVWAVQMSTVEFHPWNSRRADTERPDEWRIDLDPMPDCQYQTIRRVASVAHEVLDELGAVGWPKTSGGRGIHIYVRIAPEYGFPDVRRAALAFARESSDGTPRRHHDLVAQGPRPHRGLRRLQPERPGPHDRRGVLRARLSGCPGVDTHLVGRDRRCRPRGVHHRDGAETIRQTR